MKNVFKLNRAGFAFFCAALSLVSIGSNASAAEKIVIGFSQATMNSTWRVAMLEGNKKYAAEHFPDVELMVTDGQNQAGKQVSDVRSLMTQGIKVLIISPVQAEPLTSIVNQVMQANIPVITLDREVNTKVTCRIGAQNRPIGVDAGEFIIEKLNGTGNVIEIEGTVGASATTDRHEGFRDALREAPRIRVVADQFCDYLREPAMKFVEDTLKRFGPGQVQAIYAHDDAMALGAMQVVEAAGRLKEIAIVGIDGENNAFQAIKDGKLAATFTYPFCAPEGIQYAYNLAIGEQVPD
ncbi:MAG: substrate-binding domain-containing protein, partial [Verrucomicrobia bacterium]|nr:substrate-binding domain-containing protein [Verrucomicrobiota bacterium]